MSNIPKYLAMVYFFFTYISYQIDAIYTWSI